MSQVIETGSILLYSSNAAPPEYLLCDGLSYSTTTYANLFAIIGNTYGATGANFNVPNLNGYFPIMGSSMGPSIGSTGGVQSIQLTNNNLPSHTHAEGSLSIGNHTHSLNFGDNTGNTKYVYDTDPSSNSYEGSGLYVNANNSNTLPSTTTDATIDLNGTVNTNTTNSSAINVINKYIVLTYIIKT
jgi:microcystin-dependent protein